MGPVVPGHPGVDEVDHAEDKDGPPGVHVYLDLLVQAVAIHGERQGDHDNGEAEERQPDPEQHYPHYLAPSDLRLALLVEKQPAASQGGVHEHQDVHGAAHPEVAPEGELLVEPRQVPLHYERAREPHYYLGNDYGQHGQPEVRAAAGCPQAFPVLVVEVVVEYARAHEHWYDPLGPGRYPGLCRNRLGHQHLSLSGIFMQIKCLKAPGQNIFRKSKYFLTRRRFYVETDNLEP